MRDPRVSCRHQIPKNRHGNKKIKIDGLQREGGGGVPGWGAGVGGVACI